MRPHLPTGDGGVPDREREVLARVGRSLPNTVNALFDTA
jgi:hypothetical protein